MLKLKLQYLARDSRASSRVETGISGNFFSCSKGVKDPLEVPDVRVFLPGEFYGQRSLKGYGP